MSITPTNYDLQQDSRIDEIQEIITTDYQEPDQTEYSYPVVDQPMSDEQWQYVTLAMGDGVLDEGGRPYWLKLNGSEANTNSTNTMVLAVSTTTGTAQGILKGFFHRLMADKTLNFPGVTSETTYYVVLRYDPTGHKEPGGPISVQVVTRLDRTQGKHYVVLWKLTRKPNQLLTDAAITRVRVRVSPTMYVYYKEHMPDPNGQLSGALCVVGEEPAIYRVSSDDVGEVGNRAWVNLTNPTWNDVADGSLYGSPGHGYQRGWRVVAGMLELRGRVGPLDGGTLKPGGGNDGRGYQIMTLPTSAPTPEKETRFITASAGWSGQKLSVITIDGRYVYRMPILGDAEWLGLDGIRIPLKR